MEEKLDLILGELKKVNNRLDKVEKGQVELKNNTKDLENKMDSEFKKVNSRLDKVEKNQKEFKGRFDHIEKNQEEFKGRFDHIEKKIHENHFKLDSKIDQSFNEMNEKQDKILSAVVEFVTRIDKNEDEIAVANHHIKGHEDRITELEEKIA